MSRTVEQPAPKPLKMTLPRRTRRIRRNLSFFTMACVAVAVGYLGYRVFQIAGPNGPRSFFATADKAAVIGCEGDGDEANASGANSSLPQLPTDYQQFIRKQPSTGGNLVANAAMQKVDSVSGLPVGFFPTAEADWAKYELRYESQSNANPYLRLATTKSVTDDEVAGGWIVDHTLMDAGGTYAYGFDYRSNATAVVSVEYHMANGFIVYDNVAELAPKNSWQSFTYYAQNLLGAKSFRVVVSLRNSGQLDTRAYGVHRIADAGFTEGVVSISFDDGWQSVNDKAIPLLNQHGFKSTQYIIGEASSKQVEGYMDVDTLKQLKNDGHEIGSHTLHHCNQAKLGREDMVKNAESSRELLQDDGLGDINSFAYPYGSYSDATRQVFAKYYPYVRSSDAGYNDRYFDAKNIRSMSVLTTTSDDEFNSWLHHAKNNRQWLVLVYHRIDEHGNYNVSSTQFKRQLEMIKASGLKVQPVGEAAASIR